MPTLEEIRYYMLGLKLLVQQKPEGFGHFDLTDRGFSRSFWAIVWCLPGMAIGWLLAHLSYVAAIPVLPMSGPVFYFREAMIDLVNWFVPLILYGLFAIAMKQRESFIPVVVINNWLSLPLTIGSALLTLGQLFLPQAFDIWVFFSLIYLCLAVSVIFRIMKMILHDDLGLALAATLILVLPNIFLYDWMQSFLGVSPT